ncbi:MAG: pantoate--beta-alanine ligase [Erythrobacter sp.]
MQTATTLDMLRNALSGLRADGASIGLVTTMGALHEGHLTLVREARKACDHVVASIFVNPTQFGPNEDLDRYPRQMAEDAAMLANEGVALLWAPSVDEMYPAGHATVVAVPALSASYCGASRPGHFDGVATVVCKLFNQVLPDKAFFGEKDYQQLAIIRRMARDLDLIYPAADRIIGVPTVREADGLAMSSRNRYLAPHDRAQAAALPRAMRAAVVAIESGAQVAETLAALEHELVAHGFSSVDYAALADAQTLAPLTSRPSAPARLLVAARIGGARLIDNLPVNV